MPLDAKDILASAPLAVIALDEEARVVFWSEAAARMTGFRAEEVTGKVAAFVPAEAREAFLARHRDAFTADVAVLPTMTLKRTRKDGTTFECTVTRAPVRDASGRVTGVVGVLEDVTDKLREEATQRRSEANFRALIEGAPDAIVVHRHGYVLYANPAMAALLRHERQEDLVGRATLSFVHPEYHEVVRRRIDALALQRRSDPLPQKFVRKDGSEVYVEVVGIAIVFDGEPAGLAIARDLTERKALEAQLRASDRLASVGRLAAAVGHEINNPLAYVIANLATVAAQIERRLPEGETREIRALLADVRDGAEHVRRIVRDLKVFSRPAGDERVPVDVHRVLDSCANMAGNEIRHRARLVRRYATHLPLVLGNEARLGQVFLNLLVNAAQAIAQGSADSQEVTLTTRGGVADDGRHEIVVVEVRDTGVGIAPDLLSHVFDPFFTTKPMHGTGLGLSISHSLVTALGGRIDVESAVGKGTCVRVTLPAAPPGSRVAEPALPPTAPTAARRRVLVVDDDARVARTVERMLEGHDVTVATSGKEAIDILRREPPFDVLLCDLMMPEVSGADVYEAVRTLTPGSERKVLFMSGGAFTPRAAQFIAEVPNRCLEKPFQLDELLRAVADTG